MSDDFLAEHNDASTHLSAEEQEGLIPSYITLRSGLNEKVFGTQTSFQ
jgi:hypothetical protein